MNRLTLWAILPMLLCMAALDAGAQTRRLVLGNEDRPWADSGELQALDHESVTGWIEPVRITPAENILHGLYVAGRLYDGKNPAVWRGYRSDLDARIWSPYVPGGENDELLALADGKNDTLSFDYFNRVRGNEGVSIHVDLGIPYPVERIVFYPLDYGYHIDMYMKGYELLASDGSVKETDADGEPIYSLLHAVPDNDQRVVVDTSFVPQYLRYLQLRCTSPQPFELDQLEIRGDGYVRTAMFTSDILDLGDIANIGRIYWRSEEDPGSSMQVQTRVGRDQTTLIYYRINELGELEALAGATDAINKAEYDDLPNEAKGGISEDRENWTLWSVPYDAPGEQVVTDGPGRYLQVRVNLETEERYGRARVDSIGVEYSQPVMARSVRAQVEPRVQVSLGQEQAFVYRITADTEAGGTGFDTVELEMPYWSELRRVSVGGRELSEAAYTAEITKESFRLQLLDESDRVVSAEQELELRFDTTILVYGTVIGGRVRASWRPDLLPQKIQPHRVGHLTVLGAEESLGKVLGEARSQPGVFSPNGDGVNDRCRIEFQVSQVIGSAPLQVRVYDLAGRRLADLLDAPAESDNFSVVWDGRDRHGNLVSPGQYLFEVRLKGDTQEFVSLGTIGVAY